jgi:hypothetical protein
MTDRILKPNPDKPELERVYDARFLLVRQGFVWLGPNPDKPELKRVYDARFLLVRQGFVWLGPNPNKPELKRVYDARFLLVRQGFVWLGPIQEFTIDARKMLEDIVCVQSLNPAALHRRTCV